MVRRLLRQPGRYLVIGAVCAVLNNIILIGGDALGLHYGALILFAFAVLLPASYLAHACWTFGAPLSWLAFVRFVMGSVTSLLVASATIWLFRSVLLLPMTMAAPLATGTMLVYNYVMTRWAVHRGTIA